MTGVHDRARTDGLTSGPDANGGLSMETDHSTCVLQILEDPFAFKAPEAFHPVYDLVNSIIAHAESDPRKFHGFEKHWSPQVLCQTLVCKTLNRTRPGGLDCIERPEQQQF